MVTKAEAMRTAIERVRMYRQGRGWIVSHYDQTVNAMRVGNETQYWLARQAVTENRLAEALHELGYNADDVSYLSTRFGGHDYSGSLAERLRLATA